MISLIIGLGNIGQQYEGTHHNIGFEVLNLVAQKLNAKVQPAKPNYLSALATRQQSGGPPDCYLAWPTTLMNRSGLAAADLIAQTGRLGDEMLVVSDDINLPLGALRLRTAGSAGGHHGLESIIEHLGSDNFPRLRVGIGLPADNQEIADFVLERFAEGEAKEAKRMVAKAGEAVIFALSHRLEEVMARYNINPALPE